MLLTGIPLVICHSYWFFSLLHAPYSFACCPQSLRVVISLVLITRCHSPAGLSLPTLGCPKATGCLLLTWSSFFQECVPSSMSPQLSLSSFVSLQVLSVYVLPAMAASLPEICLSWDAVGSSVCLAAALMCGSHPDCFQKWPHPAVTGTWVPTTQVPTTAPAAETQPCMGKHILSETER